MPVMFTSVVQIKDWKAFRELNRDILVEQFAVPRPRRYRVYRNLNDASQALLVAELPDYEAIRDLRQVLYRYIDSLSENAPFEEHTWELIGWEGIDQE